MKKNYNLSWIWIDCDISDNSQMVLFYKSEVIEKKQTPHIIKIAADSRYKLFVNGEVVSDGPCRTTADKKFYDMIDISNFLKQGKNEMLVKVAHYSSNDEEALLYKGGPSSVICTSSGGLWIDDSENIFSTNSTWTAKIDESYSFIPIVSQLSYMEKVDGRLLTGLSDYSSYLPIKEIENMGITTEYGQKNRWSLFERPIPLPLYLHDFFSRVTRFSKALRVDTQKLCNGEHIIIDKNSDVWIELDAGEYRTAFLRIFAKGKDAHIKIEYAEGYFQKLENGQYKKLIRDDYNNESAKLIGVSDIFISDEMEQMYMTFLYRSFRFVRLNIKTYKEPLTFKIDFVQTGYPLIVEAEFETQDELQKRIWDISLRTLKSCMYETYMDCPFYEQLQYTMDTMLQTVYTYSISTDDRLARKAIEDFYSSQLSNGLIPCCSPAKYIQIIPGFVLFWIFMIEEHYRYYKDIALVKKYICGVMKVISYFDDKINDDNLLSDTSDWQFVDWVRGWENGSPVSGNEINLIYNMILIKAIRTTAFFYGELGFKEFQAGLIEKAEKISKAVIKFGYDENTGLLSDVPNKKPVSMHAQLWAVLSGTVKGEKANVLLNNALAGNLLPVSYCYNYLLFRALDKAGFYIQSKKIFENYIKLIRQNVTTWPEDDLEQRSDCHAWGAVALSEFMGYGLGVRPEKCGFEEILINPKMLWLKKSSGIVPTIKGNIMVNWEISENTFNLSFSCDKPNNFKVIMPSEKQITLKGEKNFSIKEEYLENRG